MAELSLDGVSLGFGGAPLLDEIVLDVEVGERIGLLGRNGSGKSSLLAVLTGRIEPDGGRIVRRPGLVVAELMQDVPRELAGRAEDLVRAALVAAGMHEEWELEKRAFEALGAQDVGPDEEIATLSAGRKRRVLLARALAVDPDLLVLDEPTNHLDVDAIRALEEELLRRRCALVFVTHDRAFLRRLATRILDLDRGVLRSYECNYETYLERRADELEAEAKQAAEFDKELAKEEAWLRRGVKARRTRNMGRVRRLQALREERAERRDRQGEVKAKLQEGGRSGDIVLRVDKISKAFGEDVVLRDFSTVVLRGDRVGIVGPNGAGKTTLLRILLGELAPDSGHVHTGTRLEVARFDQLAADLDLGASVQENLCGDGDNVTVNGVSRHVIGYLGDFLFTPDQIRGPVWRLSGGERNRLQLARILARPANLLVLDEPTNDLDLETLELLEELLDAFEGTLLLVSHDREFLDNVVTQALVFEAPGRVREVVGGWDAWQKLLARERGAQAEKDKQQQREKKSASPLAQRPRKLTYAEKIELEQLPARIEELERSRDALVKAMSTPAFFQRPGPLVAADHERLKGLQTQLDKVYSRWEALETIAEASAG